MLTLEKRGRAAQHSVGETAGSAYWWVTARARGRCTVDTVVPTSLTVNPSLTIAALAERASVAIAARCSEAGIALRPGIPVPGTA